MCVYIYMHVRTYVCVCVCVCARLSLSLSTPCSVARSVSMCTCGLHLMCTRWLRDVREGAGPGTVVVLVGNKLDLAEHDPSSRQVVHLVLRFCVPTI